MGIGETAGPAQPKLCGPGVRQRRAAPRRGRLRVLDAAGSVIARGRLVVAAAQREDDQHSRCAQSHEVHADHEEDELEVRHAAP